MEEKLHHITPLAKTQEYVANHYNSPSNEPWCYHMQFSYHIRIEDLSWPFLFKALKGVLNRHPVFKTVILFEGGKAVKQAINSELNIQTRYSDISHLSNDEQIEYVNKLLLDDKKNVFDLQDVNQPIFRTYILKRGNDHFQLVLGILHAIWDGWSLAMFTKEIFGYYQDLKKNPSHVLSDAIYEYKDFVHVEKNRCNNSNAKEFWEQHLTNHIPFKRATRQVISNYDTYKPVTRKLPVKLTTTLQFMQPKLRATIKSICAALFVRMIAEESKLSHATIGVVTNGRTADLENPMGTLGLLWDIAPLCVENLQDDMEHIRNVGKLLNQISSKGSYPFLKILEDRKDPELLHGAFNFINFDGAGLLPSDSNIEMLDIEGFDKFKFPINMLVAKNPFNKEMSLVINYDTRYYSENEIEEKIDLYVKRLEQVASLE